MWTQWRRWGLWAVLGVVVLAGSGCATWQTQTTGVPFVVESEDPRAALATLAHELAGSKATVAQVLERLELLAPGATEASSWTVQYGPGERHSETLGVRFAQVQHERLSMGVRATTQKRVVGYALTVVFASGRAVAARAEHSQLNDEERAWSTNHLLSVGTAAAGTGLLLLLR